MLILIWGTTKGLVDSLRVVCLQPQATPPGRMNSKKRQHRSVMVWRQLVALGALEERRCSLLIMRDVARRRRCESA
jgi:hypothetical protein